VAGALQRQAAQAALPADKRRTLDECVTYLLNKARYLRYDRALATGWPIATGVIEGACRHLVQDRMDLIGARWGLPGAEAILKLRAMNSNGDFHTYWTYHLGQRNNASTTVATLLPPSLDDLPPREPHPHNTYSRHAEIRI